MADSDALRSRRYQRHRRGDHALCRPGCSKLTAGAPAALVVVPEPAAPLDVREALTALARRLEAAHVIDPSNAMVARELRATLLALPPEEAADPLADLREFSKRVS